MEKAKQILQGLVKKYIFLLLIILAISISILPDIYRLKQAPPGTTFPLIHNHPEDYFSYLSYMHTGAQGGWKVTSRLTSERFEPQFVYTLFILLGKIGKITQISLPWIYFTARIVFGGMLLYVCYLAVSILFNKFSYRFIGCIFVFFSTGFWYLENKVNGLSVQQYITSWTHFDPLMRTTFLPHHLLAASLGLMSLVLLAKAVMDSSIKKAVAAGIIGLLAGLSYHGTMTNILGGLAVASVIYSLTIILRRTKKSRKILFHDMQYFLLYISISVISLVYILSLTRTVWPFTASSNLGGKFTVPVTLTEYIGVLGPTLILTILGLRRLFGTKSLFPIIILGWVIFPFIGIFFLVNYFPQWSNMPYLEATSYIPLGMLAVYGLQEITSWFGKYSKRFLYVITLLLMIYFIPAYLNSWQKAKTAIPLHFYNRYIPNPILEAVTWLGKNTRDKSIVLSGGLIGPIIPAFSHNYVVYGDDNNTYRGPEKAADMVAFFSQSDTDLSLKILKKYSVDYVFYSMDTDPVNKEFIEKLPLTAAFTNSHVTIYKVN